MASAHLPQSWQVYDWWAQWLVGRINMICVWKIAKRARRSEKSMSIPVSLLLLWQKRWRERGEVSSSLSYSHHERKSGQEAETREECCLLSYSPWFAQPRSTCPGLTPPRVVWAPLYPSLRKCPHRLAYRPVWLGHFFHWGSLFSNDPSLCYNDKNCNP